MYRPNRPVREASAMGGVKKWRKKKPPEKTARKNCQKKLPGRNELEKYPGKSLELCKKRKESAARRLRTTGFFLPLARLGKKGSCPGHKGALGPWDHPPRGACYKSAAFFRTLF